MIIACEDIGIGSIDAVIATVRACTDLGYRRTNGGNASVIAHVVRQLALSPKDRSADHLIAAAAEHPKLEAARRRMASLAIEERLELVADAELPLTVRAVAAWYASGLQWRPEHRISGGDALALMQAYRRLGVPPALIGAVEFAARRTREPLAVLLPLLWLSLGETPSAGQTELALFPPGGEIEGVPLYTFDLHTRLGRQALDALRVESTAIRAVLMHALPDRSGYDAVRFAAFHVEAALVDRPLGWPPGRNIEALGIETDLLSAGVKREGHAALLAVVRANIDHLNDLRKRAYCRSGLRLCRG
jgi:GNAT superfamily N-acetyltransferase